MGQSLGSQWSHVCAWRPSPRPSHAEESADSQRRMVSHWNTISVKVMKKLLISSWMAVHTIDSMNATSWLGARMAQQCSTCGTSNVTVSDAEQPYTHAPRVRLPGLPELVNYFANVLFANKASDAAEHIMGCSHAQFSVPRLTCTAISDSSVLMAPFSKM